MTRLEKLMQRFTTQNAEAMNEVNAALGRSRHPQHRRGLVELLFYLGVAGDKAKGFLKPGTQLKLHDAELPDASSEEPATPEPAAG